MGFDITREAVKAKQMIGIVPESSNIYEEMTALQNLIFSSQLYGVPRSERKNRAHELLELFNLLDRANSRVEGLSRGMKRRLTIACALVHRPKILFLDEPTAGLDAQSARQLRTYVSELKDLGVTVLLTTHYIEEADQLCDTVAMINKGQIVALDSPDNLKNSITGTRIVEVTFSSVVSESKLSEIEGVLEVHKLGDRYKLVVGGESDIVRALVDYAKIWNTRITALNTLKPSLEDAFLRITGLIPMMENGSRDHKRAD